MVVVPPCLTFMLGVGQAQEPIRVEALRPDPSVERFREGSVGRLFPPAEVQRDVVLVDPRIEILRYELRPLSAYAPAFSAQSARALAIAGR